MPSGLILKLRGWGELEFIQTVEERKPRLFTAGKKINKQLQDGFSYTASGWYPPDIIGVSQPRKKDNKAQMEKKG